MSRLMTMFAGLALFLGFVATGPAVVAAKDLEVGDDAPAFEMQGSDDETYKLEDFRDK